MRTRQWSVMVCVWGMSQALYCFLGFFAAGALSVTFVGVPGVQASSQAASSAPAVDHGHKLLAETLSRALVNDAVGSGSRVKYAELKSDPQAFPRYLKELETVSAAQFDAFTSDQKLAFWINAYNAFTVELILRHYPVNSIKDIGGFFSSPWKKKFFTLLGKVRTLDEIEHEIIRKKFDEPRIHFALVCAAKGCPALRDEPFVAARLDAQLTDAARKFLSDPSKNRYEPDKKTLFLSSIFKWYGKDFKSKHGSFLAYIAPFVTQDASLRIEIASEKVKVEYLDYDWSLNQTP